MNIPDLLWAPKCARAEPSTDYQQWYGYISSTANFDICHDCYVKWVVPARWESLFQSEFRDEPLTCDMNHHYVRQWFELWATRQPGHLPDDHSHFMSTLGNIRQALPECDGSNDEAARAGKWYSVRSEISGEPIPTLYCCEYCVKMLSNVYGPMSEFIETCQPTSEGLFCDFQVAMNDDGTVENTWVPENVAAVHRSSGKYKKYNGVRDMSIFVNFAWSRSCPKDTRVACAIWLLPGYESSFICDKCYWDEVAPHLQRNGTFLSKFTRSTKGDKSNNFYWCQFWPRAMKECLQQAIEANDMAIITAKVQERNNLYFQTEMKKIELRSIIAQYRRQGDLFNNEALCSQMLAGSAGVSEIMNPSTVS